MKIKSKILIVIVALFSCVVNGQTLKNGSTVDRIVAIVGNEIIMQSDIDGMLLQLSLRDPSIKLDNEEQRKSILDTKISEKILIVKAEEDSVSVADEEIEDRWLAMQQNMVQTYGSLERVEAAYKKSMNRIKIELRDEIKKMLMARRLEETKFGETKAALQDVEEFYDKYKDSLPMIPEQVELFHIVKYIYPDTNSKVKTYNLAKSIRDSILNSQDTASFAEFATKYSADLGSAKDGGFLGWATKGKFIQEFERTAYALQPHEISLPVETPFGYHIIQLIEKKRDSLLTRHILFKIERSDADAEKVKATLDSIKKYAQENNNFLEMAKELSEEKETQGFGGALGKHSLGEYPLTISESVRNLKDGDISEPALYSMDPTKSGMNIVYRKATIPEHKPTIDTDYDFLKMWASEYKRTNLRNKWIEELKRDIYWEIVAK